MSRQATKQAAVCRLLSSSTSGQRYHCVVQASLRWPRLASPCLVLLATTTVDVAEQCTLFMQVRVRFSCACSADCHFFSPLVSLSHSSRTQTSLVHSPPRGFALAFSTTTGDVSVLQPIFTVPPPLSTTSVGIPPAAAAPAIASLVCESKSTLRRCTTVATTMSCKKGDRSVGLLNIGG